MSDLDLFSHSDEESDSRGSYESPMSYKEYVALSKSSSSLKRRRHPERPPVVLQTSCSSEDDDYAPLSKTKYDQRGSRVDYGRRPPPSRLKADQQSSGVDNGRRSHLGPKAPSTGTKDKVHTPLTDVTNTNPSKSTNSVEEGSDRKNESADTHSLAGIEKALLETNQLLRGVLKRVDKCEKQIKSFETKLNETSSTSSGPGCTPSRKKGQIPEDVRRETRHVYYMLLEEDETFDGWNCNPSVTFKDKENQKVVNKLVTEVKGLNNHFISQHIRDAAYRFYRSHREEQSLKRRGKCDDKQKKKRRHERKIRKLEERTAVLCKGKFSNPKDRERWEKVLCLDLMSSEESGFDDGDEILITRPLPWRSPRVDQLFKELDKHSLSEKSPQARRQMKHRSVGNPSTRPCCVRDGVPEWAFSN